MTSPLSLPQRQYDLLSRILASAVARAEGTRFGREHRTRTRPELRRLADALAACGYEPRVLAPMTDRETLRGILERCPPRSTPASPTA